MAQKRRLHRTRHVGKRRMKRETVEELMRAQQSKDRRRKETKTNEEKKTRRSRCACRRCSSTPSWPSVRYGNRDAEWREIAVPPPGSPNESPAHFLRHEQPLPFRSPPQCFCLVLTGGLVRRATATRGRGGNPGGGNRRRHGARSEARNEIDSISSATPGRADGPAS